MQRIVMAVRDRAADCFMQPMFVAARGMAVRAFQDEINRAAEGNPLFAHPEDFDLYELGVYDDTSGKLSSLDGGPKQVAVGKDFKQTTK